MSGEESVEFQLVPGSRKLYLFFGGIAAGIAMPPFEFYNSARILDENKIFFRDFSQSWYHAGLAGITTDLPSTARYIREQIDAIGPDETFFVGNSMGGYAAILFAALTGRGQAIAFAPQTFLSPRLRVVHGDGRWKRQVLNTYLKGLRRPRAWDLRRVLMREKSEQKSTLFVSTDDRLDQIHASHLKGLPNVRIVELSGGGHEVVRTLRDQGKLPAILAGTYE